MVKIAVATTDGKVVNQHFGKASKFYIIEADEEEGSFRLIEVRKTGCVCQGGDHEEQRMREVVQKLTDCRYVLVSRVGERARNVLEAYGVEIYEIPGIIEECVDKLIRFSRVQKLLTIE